MPTEVIADAKNKFTGTEADEFAYSTDKNDTFDLKTGTDTINFDCDSAFGKDTVVLNKDENLTVKFNNYTNNQIEYNLKGKDIIITVYGKKNEGYWWSADKSKVYGTVTIKNGADRLSYGETGTLSFSPEAVFMNWYNTDSNMYMGNASSTKNQTLKGSFRDEFFTDGYGNDVIHTTEGNNVVGLGKGGENKVYLEGNDTISFAPKAYINYTVTGGDTVYNSDSTDTLSLAAFSTGSDYVQTQFAKSGNDLTIIQNGQYEGGAGKITVKDYFSAEEKIKLVASNNSDYHFDLNNTEDKMVYTYPSGTKESGIYNLVEGKGNINGKDEFSGNDVFIAKAKSIVNTGSGDDIIYTSSAVDTININGTGTKTIVVRPESGDDVVNINNTNANVKIDLCQTDYTNQTYTRNGNDLKISYTGYTYNTKKDSYESGKAASLTVKNYFGYTMEGETKVYNYDKYNLQLRIRYYQSFSDLKPDIEARGLTITGKGTIEGSDLKENIIGSTGADKIYTGAGDDTISAGKGNDTITVDGEGNKTIKLAKGDGKDTIILGENATSVNIEREGSDYPTFAYSKSGNDLIIHRLFNEYANGDVTTTEEQTIVKDYYDNDGNILRDIVKLNGSTLANSINYIAGGNTLESLAGRRGYIQGTTKADTVTVNGSVVNYYETAVTGNGNDSITTTGEFVQVYADAGNDTISVNSKFNHIYGGSGNDVITVEDPGTVTTSNSIHLGAGNDTVTVRSRSYAMNSVYADAGNDVINIEGSGNAECRLESGKNIVNVSGNALARVNSGSGDDTISFNGGYSDSLRFDNTNSSQLDGNDTVRFLSNPSNTVRMYFSSDDLTYTKNGNNLLIQETVQNPKGKNVLETVTIEDYFARYNSDTPGAIAINDLGSIKYAMNNNGLNIAGVKNGKQTDFIGTGFNDSITGSTAIDNILTGNGNDTIMAGKGNDTITVDGAGNKTIKLAKGDGTDTVILGDGATYVNITDYECSWFAYSKQGDDLIANRIYTNNYDISATETTTVKDYYKDNAERSDVVVIGGKSLASSLVFYSDATVTENDGKMHFAAGTKKADNMTLAGFNIVYAQAGNDTITATGYGTIYAGDGNDSITVTGNVGYAEYNIYAGKGNDTISLNASADVELEEGNNTVYLNATATDNQTHMYSGSGNDTFIFNGVGNDVWIMFSNFWGQLEGNDTIRFEADLTDKLVVQFRDDAIFTKKGDNLVVTENFVTPQKKKVTENVTLENYFTNESAQNNIWLNGASEYYNTVAESFSYRSLNIEGVANKQTKQTDFVGSKYNDAINGTDKVDNILTGDGNDKINAGKGNDEITVNGSGTKTINILNGDGIDTISFADDLVGTANLVFFRDDAISWDREDDNLILLRTFDNASKVETEKTVVAGYFADGFDDIIQVNGNDFDTITFSHLNIGDQKNANNTEIDEAQNYVASAKNDTISVNADAEIFTGAGNDEITINNGNVSVHTGAGNDTVTVNSEANVEFIHNAGDGNDTIVFGEKPASAAMALDVKLNKLTEAEYISVLQSGKLGIVKSGTDFIFSKPNGSKAETVTVKDYFAQDSKKPDIINVELTINGEVSQNVNTLDKLIDSFGINVSGVTDNNKLTTFFGEENYSNRMNAIGKTKADMFGGYKSDVYMTDLNKNSQVYIQDKDAFEDEVGNEVLNYDDTDNHYRDSIIINSKPADMRMFFNVANIGCSFYDDYNLIVTDDYSDFDSMVFLNKTAFTMDNIINILSGNGNAKGYIQIDDYFARQKTVGDSEIIQTPDDYRGEGFIERVYTGKSEYSPTDIIWNEEWMRNIKQDIVTWFAENSGKGYTSVIDVINKGIESGNMTDANAVLALYQNSDYTQIPM